jgi:membrane protein required for colicin V production
VGCLARQGFAQNSLECVTVHAYKIGFSKGRDSVMNFELLDIILVGIMLISGVLALMRGFTREVLSIIAWGLAALAAYFAIKQPKLIGLAAQYIENDKVQMVAVGVAAFLIVLILTSIVSVKLSDAVVDSAAGAVDRTLGFLFGLARGLVLVAMAYLLYTWLQPADRQEAWIKDAQTLPLIQTTSNMILAFMPPNMVETLSNSAQAADPQTAPDPAQPSNVSPGDAQNLENLSNGATQQQTAPAN